MKTNLVKKRYFIAIFLLLIFIVHHFIHQYKEYATQEYLTNKTDAIYLEYKVIYKKHQDMADLLYKTEINRPEIIKLFKNRERKKLRQQLLAYYKELRTFSIRQVHFHLPNNDSFLRMHRPLKFGDNLTKDRLTVKYVNENLKPINGFEEGKVFNGFRFVYPLFDGDEHIGSVEISFSALSFIKDIVSHYKVLSNFHVKKKIVDAKVFKDEQSNYIQSPLPQYYCQKSIVEYIGVDLSTVKRTKEQTTHIYNKIQEGAPFSQTYKNYREITTFIPLKNPITDEVTAVFSFNSDDIFLAKYSNYLKIIFLISMLIIGVTLLFLYKELRYKVKLREEVKKKTQEIKESVQLLDNVIKGSNLGYWDWYPQTKEHSVNDRWLEMLGLDRDDITNSENDWIGRVHPDDLKLIIPIIEDAIDKNIPYRIEFRMLHKEGHYIWIQGAGSVIEKDSSNRAIRISGTHSDITLEVQLKKEQELHMQQLMQQSRLAQMGEMISMIAHQWRQPLSAISATSANVQLKIELEEFDLETKEGVEESKEYILERLARIDSFVQNLTTTIDDFRNFYKPDKKLMHVKLDEVIKKALNIIKASLESDNIEIIEQYNATLKFKMHENEMVQVVLNILKNAQDNFREKETKNPQIIIKTEDETIFIYDNGGGISEDIIDQIFDPYFSTKDEKNGTGLGLYMSKIIVEEHHNAKLNAINKDGGACFTIKLVSDEH